MALMLLTAVYFLIFSLCVGFSLKQKFEGINNDYLYIYLSLILAIDFSVLIAQQIFHTDISVIYLLADIINVVFTYFYFNIQIGKVKYLSQITILAIFGILFLNDWQKLVYSDYCSIISCFFTIIVCLLGFYKLLHKKFDSAKNIYDIPFFWYATAVLLWGTSFLMRTIPRFYFQSADDSFMEELRLFFAIINIITYFLFFILLLKYQKNGKTTLSG